MACSNCKNKEKIDDLMNTSEFVSKGAVWFMVIWSLFAIYGVYSLITKFL